MTTLAQYDAARAALAQATRIDEVLPLLDEFELAKVRARQIKDQALLADATEFQLRAERRLGQVIEAAKSAGLFRQGRQPEKSTGQEPFRPTLAEAGIDKKLSARAQGRASIAEQAFELMVAQARERIAAGGAKIIDDANRAADKQAARAEREAALGAKQAALPKARYGVIVADPEWRFEPWSRSTGMDRSADNHYPTSCLDVIKARDVPSIAADDCVLFLWATVPMLPHALAVMEAWGFAYVSHYVWDKQKAGTGYWNRNVHELLLIGTRGKIPAPAPGTQKNSIIEAPATKHSAKPELFLEMIEGYYPSLPKIELNRRGPPRKGWAAWGNQAEPGEFDATTGELHPHPRETATPENTPAVAHEPIDLTIPDFLRRVPVPPRASISDDAGNTG
jgi:N6-adenosine-specific RNA methylase IME4